MSWNRVALSGGFWWRVAPEYAFSSACICSDADCGSEHAAAGCSDQTVGDVLDDRGCVEVEQIAAGVPSSGWLLPRERLSSVCSLQMPHWGAAVPAAVPGIVMPFCF